MTNDPFRPFGVEHVKPQKLEYSADGAWVCAGSPENIPQGKAVTLHLPHFRVAVFHIGKELLAIKNACPHAEYPLSKGIVSGESITCASHGWRFNLRTGCGERGEPATDVRTFPVEIRNGKIWVKILSLENSAPPGPVLF